MPPDRPGDDDASSADSSAAAPKFSFSAGAGVPLGALPAVRATGPRGAKRLQLEAALEPLHRLVYGKPGVRGSRRRALEDFRGFPDAFAHDVAAKFARLKKDTLRDMVRALGLGFTVSKPQGELAKEIVDFMMCPALPAARGGKRQRREAPAEKKAVSHAEEKTVAETEAKRERKEVPIDGRAGAPSAPSDDALRVAVYKRVLVMTRAERVSVGMRNLRDEMERLFKVPAGSLRDRKSIMAETALECVSALVDAEAAAQSAEPSPAPQRPRASEPAAAAVGRSNAPSHDASNSEKEGGDTRAPE